MSTTLVHTKEDVKEVVMDVPHQESGSTRRRRRAGRRTARAEAQVGGDEGGATIVEKAEVTAPVVTATTTTTATPQSGGSTTAAAPVVVIAPAKKKPAKVMLVPKSGVSHLHVAGKIAAAKKTFKAKRVRVTIDNTAKTVKHRRQMLQRVDAMSDDQVRAAAVSAKLARREKVAAVPVALLRQMLRDYQTMRGMLL